MRRTHVTIILAASLASILGLAHYLPAQPVQGDLVVTSDHKTSWNGAGIFYVSWPSSTLKTLYSGLTSNAVRTAYGNTAVLVLGTNSGALYKVSSLGTYVTFTAQLPAGGAGIELDQDNSYMVINFDDYRMYRVSTTGTVSTFAALSSSYGHPNGICRDGDTGDWVVGTSSGLLLLVDRDTAAVSTLASGLGAIYDVEFMERTGEFAIVRDTGLTVVRRTGSVRYSKSVPYANTLTVNHKTGRIYTATYLNHQIVELTSSLSIVRSYAYNTPSSLQFTGIDVWDDQNVSTIASGEQGSKVTVILRFFSSRNKPYAVALSLGQRPGIAFSSNNVLNMNLDNLFLLTAGGNLPYWTYKFAGTTSSTSGLAYAYFTIPWHLSAGTCIYVGAAAVNAAAPDNLDVSNVVPIQIK